MAWRVPHLLLVGLVGKASSANTDQANCSKAVGAEEASLFSSKAKTKMGRLLLAQRQEEASSSSFCAEYETGVCGAIDGATTKKQCNNVMSKKKQSPYNEACDTEFPDKQMNKECKKLRKTQKKSCRKRVKNGGTFTIADCANAVVKKHDCPSTTTWRYGDIGEACTDVCIGYGEVCEQAAFQQVTDIETIASDLGANCYEWYTHEEGGGWAESPHLAFGDSCYKNAPNDLAASTCEATPSFADGARRFCPCTP